MAILTVVVATLVWGATATVTVWNITTAIGHNPDAAREDILGLTGHVNTATNPQTVAAVIDNGNNPQGPCGLIFMNPATNVFLDYGLGFGFADGIDINQTAPLLTGPISTVFGAAIFQPGDTWGGISGSPPLFVNLKGTNNFRFYSVSSARGVKINQLTGKVFFTDSFGGTINQLDPSTNIVTTWSVGGNPYYLTIDSSGNIFVAVALAGVAGGMDAIVKLTPGGAFTAWKIPGGGLAPGFNGLALNGIALDTAGNVWVALSASNEVGRLNPVTNEFCKFTQAGLTAHPQQIASTGAGITLQAFWTEAGAGEGGSDLMGAVTVLTQSSAVPETGPGPCPAPTPATGTIVPSTSTASFSDSIRTPRVNTILPTVFTVTSTSTPGIDRFPMPFPTGGTTTAPNAPSGMTGVVLPNTVFGTYQDTSFTTNSAFFEVNSPVIVAPPPTACRNDNGEADEDDANHDGGTAHITMNETECDDDANEMNGEDDFQDPSSGINFRSTKFASVHHDDVAHTVTVTGLGTNNGSPVTFTIVAVDSKLVPPGKFSITLSNGYSNIGNLRAGSILLRKPL